MLEATPLPPAHVVGVVEPRRGEATVEKIAVNAVMAGCRPEYFPAVVAAVRGGVRAALQPLRAQHHDLLRHAGADDQRPGAPDARHRVRLLLPRPQRPRQRDHRPRAAPGDAQRRRLDSRRRQQVDVRPAGPRLARASASGRSGARGSRSTSAAAFAPSRAWSPSLRHRHAGHRRHLGRDAARS